jgi:peptidoglycan-associated lipoprotein
MNCKPRLTLPVHNQIVSICTACLQAALAARPSSRKFLAMARPSLALIKRLFLASFLALFMAACASTTPDQLPISQQGAAVPGSSQDFTVNVGDRVFFETDSTNLTAEGQLTLDRQSVWLNQYPQYAITLEGHADERGTREYNLALGARRAAATRDYLISRGVAPTRLQTISYGKERPVATCNDITCWSQNRRAVTVLQGG